MLTIVNIFANVIKVFHFTIMAAWPEVKGTNTSCLFNVADYEMLKFSEDQDTFVF